MSLPSKPFVRARTARAAAAAAISLIVLGAAVVVGAAPPPTPGGTDLLNLEHVYHYGFSTESDEGVATDIAFFTSLVPVRDYATGVVTVDEAGAPVLADREFAVVGSEGQGAFIFDISDPERTQFVRRIVCNQTQNNPEIRKFGDRWILALTADTTNTCIKTPRFGQSVGQGVSIYDVTDPYLARPLYAFRTTGGAHNFAWHPTKPYAWVADGDLPGRVNHLPIIDFSDLETDDPTDTPKLVNDLQSIGGPHDVSFSADGSRAYVSSENNFRIYDTTDPAHPVQLSTIGVSPGTYAHSFDVTPDGRYAIGVEESLVLGGFFTSPAAVCPGEGLVIYAVGDPLERGPVPVGHFNAEIAGPSLDGRACTAHQGNIAPNSHVMVLGWYGGGVRIVDFSTPQAPTELGHATLSDGEMWTAKFYKGPYIYTGDMIRGFDVFRWSGDGPAPWLAP